MLDTTPPPMSPKGFAQTHCMKCQAGFVRTSTEGQTFLMCLLDRETVFQTIASCNKFKANAE